MAEILRQDTLKTITLKSGKFYDEDAPGKAWDVHFNVDLVAHSNYDVQTQKTTCTITYEWWMSVPKGIRLGPWTDWDGSHFEIGAVQDFFNEGLAATNNINGSSAKRGFITGKRTIIVNGNATGAFDEMLLKWNWGVRAYRKSDKKGAWTECNDNVHFWNPFGELKIQLPDAPNAIPQRIAEKDISISYTLDRNKYGYYNVDVKWTGTTPVTQYQYAIYEEGTTPSFNHKDIGDNKKISVNKSIKINNNSKICVTIVPYNGNNTCGGTTILTNQISWPTLYIRDKENFKIGRVWIQINGVWKLSSEVYTYDQDTGKYKKTNRL